MSENGNNSKATNNNIKTMTLKQRMRANVIERNLFIHQKLTSASKTNFDGTTCTYQAFKIK